MYKQKKGTCHFLFLYKTALNIYLQTLAGLLPLDRYSMGHYIGITENSFLIQFFNAAMLMGSMTHPVGCALQVATQPKSTCSYIGEVDGQS